MNELETKFAALRGSEPYLDDAGFTMAVMAELPRRNELPAWMKNIILLAATMIGSALTVWELPPALRLPSVLKLAGETVTFAANLEFIAIAALAVYAISAGVVWAARKELI